MRFNRKTSFAAGAISALVLGSGTAFAATGGNFILGKSNTAGATSSLTNKKGTALALNSRAGTAPLKVNRSVKVARLNADKLDGKNSSSFASANGRTGFRSGAGLWTDLDGDGVDDGIVAFADCPVGTQLTGGGAADFTGTGYVAASQPIGDGTWVVFAVADPAEDAAAVEAYAVCYSPRGAVPGAIAARKSADADSKELFLRSLSGRADSRR